MIEYDKFYLLLARSVICSRYSCVATACSAHGVTHALFPASLSAFAALRPFITTSFASFTVRTSTRCIIFSHKTASPRRECKENTKMNRRRFVFGFKACNRRLVINFKCEQNVVRAAALDAVLRPVASTSRWCTYQITSTMTRHSFVFFFFYFFVLKWVYFGRIIKS